MLTRSPTPALVAARRVDFRLKRNSFSRWKYRQVDLFIASSNAIRDLLIADGVAAANVVTVYEGIDVGRIERLAPVNVRAQFFLPHNAPVVGNVAALVPHKGQRHLIDAMPMVLAQVPDARAGGPRRRPSSGRSSSIASNSSTSSATSCCQASATMCWRASRGSTCSC